MQMLTETLI